MAWTSETRPKAGSREALAGTSREPSSVTSAVTQQAVPRLIRRHLRDADLLHKVTGFPVIGAGEEGSK